MLPASQPQPQDSTEPTARRGRPRKLWAGLDVAWFRDPRTRRLSGDQKLLFIGARLYASEHMTDGIVEGDAIPMIAAEVKVSPSSTAGLVRGLLVSGLWQEVDPGIYQDLEFDRTNQSAEEREKRWARDRNRKRTSPEFPPEFPNGNGRPVQEFPHGMVRPEERQRQSQSYEDQSSGITPRLNKGVGIVKGRGEA